ncbi:MAG: tRNA (guanine(46)-N(7))-methyltransferase TrmB [Thermoanaerobaculia bacterium]
MTTTQQGDAAGAPAAHGINPRITGFEHFDFETLFGNANSVVLELGSGKGRFLLESAISRPDRNFLGVEKSLHYYRVIEKRLARAALPNVRIVNHDALRVLGEMIPDASIAEVHIYFPDPWPRKREQRRRMVRPEIVEQIRRVMYHDAIGVYVTDHEEFFVSGREVLTQYFEVEEKNALDSPPRTNYEAKYRAEGRPIYEVRFRIRS